MVTFKDAGWDLFPGGCQADSLKMLLQILEPIRPALDVDDVAPVQEAVQNCRGHYLVSGEDLRPVLHGLVRGDNRSDDFRYLTPRSL